MQQHLRFLTLAVFAACASPTHHAAGSPDTGSARSDAPTPPGDAGVPAFIKHGDNGAAACDAFCAGSQWGPVGVCLGSLATNFPCSQAPGYLSNGSELACTCDTGGTFTKPGDNGTASCDTYCAGSQWGEVGTCVNASLQATTSVMIDGTEVPYDADCAILPGVLANSAELTCICAAAASPPQ
jgi:hypothetical protein